MRPPVFMSVSALAMAKDVTAQQIERDAKWAQRWDEVRAFGRWRFIWLIGVVGWGVPVGVLTLAWRWWDTGTRPTLSNILVTAIVITIAGGITFGALIWRRAERNYQRWVDSQSRAAGRVFD